MDGTGKNLWLVVEDNDDDFFLFRRACACAFDDEPYIHREQNGIAAKAFLSEHSEPPSLIISDLKMPQMDGLELLEWVRKQDALRGIPFVMLSSSDANQDVETAKQLGVDDYWTKPTEFRRLIRLVEELNDRQAA